MRAHPTDAGVDVFAAETVIVKPGDVLKCRTGVCVHAEPGPDDDNDNEASGFNQPGGWTYAAFVWDKSGLAAKGLTTLGGVIDDPYTGEILVVVTNAMLGPPLRVVKDSIDRTIRALARAMGGENSALGDQLEAADILRTDALNTLFNVEIKTGEKLAQLVIQRVELATVEGEPRALTATARGAKGFASTGA